VFAGGRPSTGRGGAPGVAASGSAGRLTLRGHDLDSSGK
jgi:hypothetical protein